MDAIVPSPEIDGRAGRKIGVAARNSKACAFPGCANRSQARGLCTGHYTQWSKGRDLVPLQPRHFIVDGMKFCPDCGETKPASAFQIKSGRIKQSQCGACVGIRLRMKTFGLTREQVVAMIAGGCEVCGDHPELTKHIHIDHDHATGKVRGVLCHACNTTLGLLNEDAARLRALAAYIERHQS